MTKGGAGSLVLNLKFLLGAVVGAISLTAAFLGLAKDEEIRVFACSQNFVPFCKTKWLPVDRMTTTQAAEECVRLTSPMQEKRIQLSANAPVSEAERALGSCAKGFENPYTAEKLTSRYVLAAQALKRSSVVPLMTDIHALKLCRALSGPHNYGYLDY